MTVGSPHSTRKSAVAAHAAVDICVEHHRALIEVAHCVCDCSGARYDRRANAIAQGGSTQLPDPIVLLKRDHHEAEAMLKDLAASKPRPRRGHAREVGRGLPCTCRSRRSVVYPLVDDCSATRPSGKPTTSMRSLGTGWGSSRELVDEPVSAQSSPWSPPASSTTSRKRKPRCFLSSSRKLERDGACRARRRGRGCEEAASGGHQGVIRGLM